jgi:hypothetical protein
VPAAGDINLLGGNRARDLQVAGQNLGQTSDTLFALYERHAQQANDTRVQDFNSQFITGMQQILRTGPEAYFNQKGADAIRGASAATERLATLKEEVIGQAPNDYQRRKLAPILDAHFASGSEQIARHVDRQQQVYERNVHLASIEVAEQEAISNPGNLAAAVTRAADATRALQGSGARGRRGRSGWEDLGIWHQLGAAFERLDTESKKTGAPIAVESGARRLVKVLELQRRRDAGGR